MRVFFILDAKVEKLRIKVMEIINSSMLTGDLKKWIWHIPVECIYLGIMALEVGNHQIRTLEDRFRDFAHTIKAQRTRIKLCTLEEINLGYIPVPKVASSSIHSMLRELQTDPTPDKLDGRTLAKTESMHPREVLRVREQCFLFSFVRNPVTRLYSGYRDKVVNAEQRRKRCTFSPYKIHFGMSFEEFIERVAQIPDQYSDQHFKSQTALLYHKGELLVNYVGKMEQFAEDWEVLSSRFRLSTPSHTRRVSGATAGMKDIPISRNALSLIMNRYANDLDHFDYRQDLESLMDQLPA